MRLFLILVLALVSCTKFGKNVTVKGRVMNPVTGEGIPNVPVIMYRSTLDYPSGSKRVKETTTDSDGYFEISKASLSKCYLTCHTTDVGDYYPIGWEKKDDVPLFDAFTISVKKGKTMHADYYAVPQGNYKIIVNNINCQGTNDTIIIRRTNQVGSFLAVDWILTGCSGYNSNFSQAPMGTVYTHYTVIRNGVSNEYDVNFEVLPNQDNIQTINY
ncbi:carboxypeptidase regulatory-like domain-containing protein [Fluviicola chungangensis]|uniref:Carboxypeptidase regulatory-like domain-containing protein n=1 Tax=Fluviicola chungangensis TaxID=2597671 RepID=A0A556MJF8_9FLAO|nr:carboxypeptidase regulatory-like domain-containing protein [Fluviicola chungangensis]TSJ40003.1 carboxypeptidase regulatory-like domain-containing protein [Fluviicola chungangensis]